VNSYNEAMAEGTKEFEKGEYKKAIDYYFAAAAFRPENKGEVKEKVNSVFNAIIALRKKAEAALVEAKKQNTLALEAKKEAEKQKDLALEAKKEVENQKDIALEAKKEAEKQKELAEQALKRNIEFQERSVGKRYQGGIIFYADSTREHGLIAAEKDFDSTYSWQDALRKCETYSVNVDGITYADWHLPSKEELDWLYLNREVVGGFTSNFYWSSTEDHGGLKDDAMGHYFNVKTNYKDADFNKKTKNRVRAIRAF
jgi:hypothetical protein